MNQGSSDFPSFNDGDDLRNVPEEVRLTTLRSIKSVTFIIVDKSPGMPETAGTHTLGLLSSHILWGRKDDLCAVMMWGEDPFIEFLGRPAAHTIMTLKLMLRANTTESDIRKAKDLIMGELSMWELEKKAIHFICLTQRPPKDVTEGLQDLLDVNEDHFTLEIPCLQKLKNAGSPYFQGATVNAPNFATRSTRLTLGDPGSPDPSRVLIINVKGYLAVRIQPPPKVSLIDQHMHEVREKKAPVADSSGSYFSYLEAQVHYDRQLRAGLMQLQIGAPGIEILNFIDIPDPWLIGGPSTYLVASDTRSAVALSALAKTLHDQTKGAVARSLAFANDFPSMVLLSAPKVLRSRDFYGLLMSPLPMHQDYLPAQFPRLSPLDESVNWAREFGMPGHEPDTSKKNTSKRSNHQDENNAVNKSKDFAGNLDTEQNNEEISRPNSKRRRVASIGLGGPNRQLERVHRFVSDALGLKSLPLMAEGLQYNQETKLRAGANKNISRADQVSS